MIYLEHGMIIQHWLFTSLEGFRGRSAAQKENFLVHHFGKKILEQNLVGGSLGDRSLFLQEERCRLLGKDLVLLQTLCCLVPIFNIMIKPSMM